MSWTADAEGAMVEWAKTRQGPPGEALCGDGNPIPLGLHYHVLTSPRSTYGVVTRQGGLADQGDTRLDFPRISVVLYAHTTEAAADAAVALCAELHRLDSYRPTIPGKARLHAASNVTMTRLDLILGEKHNQYMVDAIVAMTPPED